MLISVYQSFSRLKTVRRAGGVLSVFVAAFLVSLLVGWWGVGVPPTPALPAAVAVDGELIGHRTETSKTYWVGPREFTTEVHSRPIHYKEDYRQPGAPWQEIRLNLHLGADGKITAETLPYNVQVLSGKQMGYVVTSKDGREEVRVQLQDVPRGYTGTPLVESNQVRWSDVWTDTDISIELTATKIRLWKHLRSERARTAFTFSVQQRGSDALLGLVSDIEAFDATGRIVAVEQSLIADGPKSLLARLPEAWERRTGYTKRYERRERVVTDGLRYPISVDTDVTYYSGVGDGSLFHTNSVWDTVHDATTGTFASTTEATAKVGTGLTGSNYEINRGFLVFNTAHIPDNASFSAATLQLYVTAKANGDNDGTDYIVAALSDQAKSTTLTTADFNNAGATDNPTEGSDRIDIGNITTGAYNTWTLNATGRGWMNVTAVSPTTTIALREGHDTSDAAYDGAANTYNEVTFSTAETADITQDPKLVVTFTLNGGTTIAAISDFLGYLPASSAVKTDFDEIPNQMASGWKLDAIAVNGDYTYNAENVADMVYTWNNSHASSAPLFLTMGNHEAETAADVLATRNYYANYPTWRLRQFPENYASTTNYSYEIGDVHVAVVNQYTTGSSDSAGSGAITDKVFEWLKEDLATASTTHLVVMGHEPAYPRFRHVGDSLDADDANRDKFVNLLASRGVVAHYVGHTHRSTLLETTYEYDNNRVSTLNGGIWEVDTGAAGTMVVGADGWPTLGYFHSNSDDWGDYVIRFVQANPSWSNPTVTTKTHANLTKQVLVNTWTGSGTGTTTNGMFDMQYFVDYTATIEANPDWSANNSGKWWEAAFNPKTATGWTGGELAVGYDTGGATGWINQQINANRGQADEQVYGIFGRVTFQATSTQSYGAMTLDVDMDDGLMVWLNGTMIMNSTTDALTVPTTGNGAQYFDILQTLGSHNAAGDGVAAPTFTPVDVTPYLSSLQNGTNTLAFWNVNGASTGSSDLMAAIRLSISGVGGPNLDQKHYRWRNDDDNEASATWKASEDTAISGVAKSSTARLRLEVSNEGTASSSQQYLLQYGTAATPTNDSWTSVPAAGSCGSAPLCLVASTLVEGDATTNVGSGLTDENTTFQAGLQKESNATTTHISLSTTKFTELEYALQVTANAVAGTAYYFRLATSTPAGAYGQLTTYSKTPQLTVYDNTVTLTLREGEGGYTGMVDASVRDDQATTNLGATDPLIVDGLTPDAGIFLKWDLSSIPAGSTITGAWVAYNVTNTTADTYEAYEVIRAWTEGGATYNTYDGTNNWGTAGGQNTTSDRENTNLGNFTAGATGVATTTLNASGIALVQAWHDGTKTNNGITIQDYSGASDSLQFTSSEGTTASRPKLTIAYTPSSNTPSLQQIRYRWRNDDGSETAATWGGSETAATTTVSLGDTKRLRLEISNEGTASSSSQFLLQYGTNANCTSGTWTKVEDASSCTGPFCLAASQLTEAAATTNVASGLTDENTTFVAGLQQESTATTTHVSLATTNFTELEYALKATSVASYATAYYFRLATTTSNLVSVVDSYVVCPSLTTVAAPAPTLTQSHYRWRLDDGNESAANWGGNEDTATSSVGLSTLVRLRLGVNNAGTASSSQQYLLEYGTGSNPLSGTWTTIPALGACSTAPFCLAASQLTEGAATTNVASGLTDADASFIAGLQKEANATTTHISLDTPHFTEIEYAFEVTSNATAGTAYYFRLATTTGNGVSGQLNAYSVTPQLTTASGGITLVQQRTTAHTYLSPTTSLTATLTSGATAGNLLVASIGTDKAAGTYTVPSGFTLIHEYSSANVSGAMAYKIAAGGETAITWSYTNAEESSLWVGEYSGLAASSVLDVSLEADSGVSAVTSLSTGTTAQTSLASELVVAMMTADTGLSVDGSRLWSNSFNEVAFVYDATAGSGNPGLSVATKILSSIGTQQTTFSCTDTGDQLYTAIATFKTPSDATRPTPTATGGPPNGQTGAPVDALVERVFSEALAAATVTTANVTLRANTGNVQGGSPAGSNLCSSVSLTESNTKVICNHSALNPDTWYTFLVSTAVTDVAGNGLLTNASYQFRTSSFGGGAAYVPPPKVASSVPVSGATLPVNAKLRVYFTPGGDTPGTDTMATTGSGSVLSISNVQLFAAQNGQPLNATNLLACATVGGNPASPTDCNLAWGTGNKELVITPGKKAPVGSETSTGGSVLTVGSQYVLKVKNTVANTDAMTMFGSAYSVTFTVSAADSTGPDVSGTYPQSAATGVDRAIYNTNIGFNEAVDAASVSATTIKLYCEDSDANAANGCSGGSDGYDANDAEISGTTVSYNAAQRSAALSPNRILTASRKHYLRVVAASGVKDIADNTFDGNTATAGNQDEVISFTTGANINGAASDSTKPAIVFVRADNFSIAVGFSEPLKFDSTSNSTRSTSSGANDVNNLSNWTLESPSGVSVNLTGKTIEYLPYEASVVISGLTFPPNQAFKVTASTSIQDLSSNAMDSTGSPARNVANGTVQSMDSSGGDVGPGTGGSGGNVDYYSMGVQPVAIFPRNAVAGATSVYEVEFGADTAIPSGGTIVLTYPAGFSFVADSSTSECRDALTTISNSDLNGPSTGTVTIGSITCDSNARTVTLTTASASTVAGDRVRFMLQGITNAPVPRDTSTGGYTVSIQTKNSSGTVLESKTSMPFFLATAGSQSIAGTIFNDSGAGSGTAGDGTKNGSEPGVSGVQICLGGSIGFTCTTSDGSGNYSFGSLSDGFYSLNIPPLTSGSLVGGPFFRDVSLTSSTSKTGVNFALRTSSRTISVSVSGIPSGTDLDVFAFNSNSTAAGGAIVRELLWASGPQDGTGTASLPVSDGTWQVGIGPWMSKDPSLGPGGVPTFTFIPPAPKSVVVSGGNATASFSIQSASNTVVGKVVDGSGSGISNVFVGARPAKLTESAGGSAFTQTKSDGTFSLSSATGVYLLEAFMPGMPPSPGVEVTVLADSGNSGADGNSTADVYASGVLITNDGSGSDNIILKMAKGSYAIAGKVLDESGNTIAYAHVSGEQVDGSGNPNGPRVDAPSDSSGNFTLYVDNGTWKLRGFAPGYGELSSLTVTVNGASLSGQNLQASTSDFGTVSGSVTQGGSGVAGVFVGIHGSSGGNGTITDALGNYELKVKAGSGYTIDGFLQGSGPTSVLENVTVSSGGSHTGKDLTLGQTGTITVTISGVTTGAYVEAIDANGRGNGTGSNSSGVYTITVPAGTYTVRANSKVLGVIGTQTSVSVSAGGTATVTFTAPTTYAVSGTISSSTSVCQNGATVFLTDTTSGRSVVDSANTSGVFSVSVPNGTYSLGAAKSGCVDSAAPGTVTVAGGNVSAGTTRTLTATDSTISGQVTQSGANVTVPTVVIAQSSDGRFLFADVDTSASSGTNYSLSVTAGTWTVRARSDGYQSSSSSVTVTAGGSTTANLTLSAISGYTRTDQQSSTMKPSQGGRVRDANVGDAFMVNIPAGALGSSSDDGSVTTKRTTAIVTQTASAVVVGEAGVEITPKNASGQKISTLSTSDGITVTIPYTDAEVTAAGVSESQMVLSVWSDEKQQWEPLATTVDADNNTLTASVTHFSVFAPTGSTGSSGSSSSASSSTATGSSGGGGGAFGVAPRPPTVNDIRFNGRSAHASTAVQPLVVDSRTGTFTFDVSDAALMLVSNSPSFVGQSWGTFQSTYPWQLADSSQSTVRVKFRSSLGGESSVQALTFAYQPGSTALPRLVKYADSQAVYLIEGGNKRVFLTARAFLDNGFSWNGIATIPKSEQYPDGAPITGRLPAPGVIRLIKYAASPRVYLVQDGRKRHITNEAVFLRLGYRWEDVVTIGPAEQYPDGDPVTDAVGSVPAHQYRFTQFLNIGSRGVEVRQLQARLRELGYFTYPKDTGIFGTVTAQAVKRFQAARGIPAVGYVGPATRAAFNQ